MINLKEHGINKIRVISGTVPKICREAEGNSFNVGNEFESGSFQIRSRNASIVWTQECFRKELIDLFLFCFQRALII
jgi:hypothetical protein